jgi:hypothetical protein
MISRMKKLIYGFRTLNDPLVKRSIEGICSLEDKPLSKGISMVVGGFAVQSYLPENQRRPTADIDVLVGRPLTNSEFKEFSKPFLEFLTEKGYLASPKKGHSAYYVCIKSKDEDEGELIVDFSRRNNEKFKRDEKMILRELEHSKVKPLENEVTYKVCSSEDIILTKLVRIINCTNRGYDFKKTDLKSMQKLINDMRTDAISNLGDENISTDLRINSDVYDVRCLYSLAGLNSEYLLQGREDWDTIIKDFPRKREILDNILPGINL